MTWNTRIVNNYSTKITINGDTLTPRAAKLLTAIHDITIAIGGGTIRLTEPASDNFHPYVPTTWAVKVIANDYIRYWGYEGSPTLVLTVNGDGTFSLPDQFNISFDGIPIKDPALAQYVGVYATNTDFWGNTFSPFFIHVDGSVTIGSSTDHLKPKYDSRNARISIDWTKYASTTFKADFSIIGTGTNITFVGDLNPQRQDGPVHFTGVVQTPALPTRFHQFVQTYEFPLSFDGSNQNPLTFAGVSALIRSSNNAGPEYFRFIPLDVLDSTKGYYLLSNNLYASKQHGVFGNSDCVPGTSATSSALVFRPVFLSRTTFKLSAPGYQNPVSGGTTPNNPVFVCRQGVDPATLIADDGAAGFQQVLKVPTTGRLIATATDLYEQWHYFFRSVDFPLSLVDSSSLQLSGGRYLTPDSNGSVSFRFVPVNIDDYTQGYHILCGDRYISFGALGQWGNLATLDTSSDVNSAAIFRPKILSTLTFMVQNISSWQVLTQPMDQSTSGILPRNAILYAMAGDNNGYAGVHQLFQLPAWSVRIMRMAYLSSSMDFNLQFVQNGKTMYANSNGVLQLLANIADPATAVVSVSPQQPDKAHSGYLMTVGGTKYVKFTANDASVALVSDAGQASPLCLTRHSDGTMSFWNCLSNHVLTSKDGVSVVFTELADPAAVEPTWKITTVDTDDDEEDVRTLSAATRGRLLTSIGNTVHLKPIVKMLRKDLQADRGSTWNISFNNTMASDYLIATPNNAFGNYADFEQGIRDPNATNDFKLKAYVQGEPNDPKHPAVALASSVKQPGGTPLTLHAGHSRAIYEQTYKVIIEAKHFVDILGLIRRDATPSGQFLAAVRNAITYLSNKPDAQNITIRILFGMPLGWLGAQGWFSGTGPYQTAEEVLRELVRDVQSSNMKVYIAYTTRVASGAWNHSKIVAVDGQIALVGGHNMWDEAYLWENPVLDVSMRLSGLAATDAHQFADYLWREQVTRFHTFPTQQRGGHRDLLSIQSVVYTASFAMPGKVFTTGNSATPPARLFTTFYNEAPGVEARSSGSGIPALSVGRMEGVAAGEAASDKAFVALLDSSTGSIRISAQAIKDHYVGYWPEEFLKALGRALVRGVTVSIFMSDATNGGSYQGDPPIDVVTQIKNRIQGKSESEIATLLANLTVRSFPPSSKWSQPAGTPGCSNHAKVIAVDGRAVSIGSQNYYPSWPAKLSEFTYIFEDAAMASYVTRNYFSLMDAWCQPPPPLPPPAPVTPSIYTVTIKKLSCAGVSLAFGQLTSDQVYLWYNGHRISPTDKKYVEMFTGDHLDVGITLPGFTSENNVQDVAIYEYDWFNGDDHLGNFKFDPAVLEDMNANQTYTMQGDMDWDTTADYSIEYIFTKS